MPLRLVIADPDIAFVSTLKTELLRHREIELVGIVSNGGDALDLVKKTRPDELLLTAFLPGLDGISLVQEVMCLPHPPVVIMCTCYLPDVLTSAILNSGVFYLLYKPQPPELIARVLLKAAEFNKINTSPYPTDDISTATLLNLGISPHYAGYRYLKAAVELCIQAPGRIRNLSGWLYHDVASLLGSTPERVERGIRIAIREAFSRGGLGGAFEKRPGNRDFLKYLIRVSSAKVD